MKNKFEMPIVGALLAFTSGNIDAYSFLEHGGVFAGLQTGNLILLGISISHGNLASVLKIVVSIFIFLLGTIGTTIIQDKFPIEIERKHLVLKIELVLLILAAVLSNVLPNVIIIGLLAVVSSAQIQEFNLIRGNKYNPVMMTINLRRLTSSTYKCLYKKNPKFKNQLLDMLLVLFSFVMGSLSIGVLGGYLMNYAILLSLFPIGMIIIIASVNTNLNQRILRNGFHKK